VSNIILKIQVLLSENVQVHKSVATFEDGNESVMCKLIINTFFTQTKQLIKGHAINQDKWSVVY